MTHFQIYVISIFVSFSVNVQVQTRKKTTATVVQLTLQNSLKKLQVFTLDEILYFS